MVDLSPLDGRRNQKRGRQDDVGELVDWALPIQEQHLTAARDGSLDLAAAEAG